MVNNTREMAIALMNSPAARQKLGISKQQELKELMGQTKKYGLELVHTWEDDGNIDSTLKDMLAFCKGETSVRMVIVPDMKLVAHSSKGYNYWKEEFNKFDDIELTTPDLHFDIKDTLS